MTGTHASRPARLRQDLGARLRRKREELGLRRSEVARGVGYTNLSKGARRVADWERGVFGPMLDEARLCSLLQLEVAGVSLEREAAQGVQERQEALGHASMAAEAALLRSLIPRLRKERARITQTAAICGVRTPAASLRILWAGGRALSLGELVDCWERGALVAQTEEWGPVHLYDGAGSALSGAGRCTGVDASGQVRVVAGSPVRFLRGRGAMGSGQEARSGLSLADVAAELGDVAPCSVIRLLDAAARPEETVWATYDPERRALRCPDGEWVAVGAGEAVDTRTLYGGVRVGGGRPRPMTLSSGGGALHLGGFQAEQLRHGRLSMQSGRVEGEGGWLPVKVEGPALPPRLLPVLEALLAPHWPEVGVSECGG